MAVGNPIIRLDDLGKRYRIGALRQRPSNFREAISSGVLSPFRYLRTRLSKASEEEILWALRHISFEVKQGEVVGVIGRNGAGKSTLLKILSRITDPTEGSATICGRVNSLLEVGTGFHAELTGRENVYMNAAIHGMRRSEINRKFDEIVAFAEVEKFIDTPVKRYSSGMYTRLAFAVAAHLEPEILVVDEVLAVGDIAFQRKCLGKMEDVAKEGRTVLFVSHNMLSIQNLCTRGVLLEHGRVAAEGGIRDVVGKYLGEGRAFTGETVWETLAQAPGSDEVRLRGVSVECEGQISGRVDIANEFTIHIDYWNLLQNARRLVSIHVHNSAGICVFTSANTRYASIKPDPWSEKGYPKGLFRTSCTVPGRILNNGVYTVTVYINDRTARDSIVLLKDALSFEIEDTDEMTKVFSANWIGAVRLWLEWQTNQLE